MTSRLQEKLQLEPRSAAPHPSWAPGSKKTVSANADRAPVAGQAVAASHDPRWVLAVRVAEQLEGEILRPEKRQRLMRLGRLMGMGDFDTCLVIAIVQDQARRGCPPAYCPAAASAQLAMVPMPRRSPRAKAGAVRVGAVVAAAVAVEALVLWVLLLV